LRGRALTLRTVCQDTLTANPCQGISTSPLTVIEGISAGVKGMEPPLRAAVKLARTQGRTWEEIGKALVVSRQSAWERFSAD
jgi:hypothetical protein